MNNTAQHAGIDKTVTEENGVISIDETINAEGIPVSAGTIARTVVFAAAWINQLFAFNGLPVVDFDPDATYLAVSSTITFMVSVVAYWKNNSFTAAAKVGDIIMGLVRRSEE